MGYPGLNSAIVKSRHDQDIRVVKLWVRCRGAYRQCSHLVFVLSSAYIDHGFGFCRLAYSASLCLYHDPSHHRSFLYWDDKRYHGPRAENTPCKPA